MSVRRLAEPAFQPSGFAFTEPNAAWARKIIKNYPEGREHSAVIPLLMRAQEQEGWVTQSAIEHVADMIGMPYIRALEVATFYTQFQLQPVGTRAHVQVCGTTPCQLRGAEDLIRVCRDKIHPEPLHTNADGTLSWEEVECQGACVNAPMVMIFKDTYEDLTPERLAEIIDAFEAGQGDTVKPGPQNGRMNSEPAAGLTSLTDEAAIFTKHDGNGQAPGAATAEAGGVPPSRAAKPKTFAPETSAALKTPSPEKAQLADEKRASADAPAGNDAAANMAEPAVEKAAKQRKHPTEAAGKAGAYKAPEKLEGEPIGPVGKRRKSERGAEPGKQTPESPDEARSATPRKPGWVKKDGGQ